MPTETTRGLIDDFYGALQKGDRARLLEILAPDAVWIPPASAPIDRTEGAEAIADALGSQIVRQMFTSRSRSPSRSAAPWSTATSPSCSSG